MKHGNSYHKLRICAMSLSTKQMSIGKYMSN